MTDGDVPPAFPRRPERSGRRAAEVRNVRRAIDGTARPIVAQAQVDDLVVLRPQHRFPLPAVL